MEIFVAFCWSMKGNSVSSCRVVYAGNSLSDAIEDCHDFKERTRHSFGEIQRWVDGKLSSSIEV